MAKYTQADVEYLAGCLNDNVNGTKPFAFLTGAGVSKSAGIPLAPRLVKMINEDTSLSRHLYQLSDVDKKDYGKCMGALAIEERRRLLDPLLENAKINWASLALASLLKSGKVQRILNFNFDNVLLRSCGICGHYPPVYDFSQNAPKEVSFLKPGGILHLHGQGSGLVMLNSEKETHDHAESLVELYRDTLVNFNLIVIGYSGTADASFEKLKAEFTGRNRLFWIGHSEEPSQNV